MSLTQGSFLALVLSLELCLCSAQSQSQCLSSSTVTTNTLDHWGKIELMLHDLLSWRRQFFYFLGLAWSSPECHDSKMGSGFSVPWLDQKLWPNLRKNWVGQSKRRSSRVIVYNFLSVLQPLLIRMGWALSLFFAHEPIKSLEAWSSRHRLLSFKTQLTDW